MPVLRGRTSSTGLSCSVVVISHNYGRFLDECLDSVRDQTISPKEVVVIDDSSTDNTRAVAIDRGVKYVRVEHGEVFYSRATGLKHTTSDIVCFLDADDCLSPEYIEEGLKDFDDHRVGISYSDYQMFGTKTERSRFPDFDRDLLHRDNYIHAGSLVRREALVSSLAFERGLPAINSAEDWLVWRRVVEQGWTARRQPATYRYRQHGENKTTRLSRDDYYHWSSMAAEVITLFVPLSGRHKVWKRFSRFLKEQEWPKDRVRLILMDTSGDKKFHKRVSNWVAHCGYPDVRVAKFWPGERSGSADEDRLDDSVRHTVQRAVARIYNFMGREVSTPYVWILEDDVVPPVDCCEHLLRSFGPDVVSVTGAIPSRFHRHYLHWGASRKNPEQKGRGVEEIQGSGFGCTILRREVLKNEVFTFDPSFCNGDYDVSFYTRLDGGKCLVNWDVLCQHGSRKRVPK